MIAYAAADVVVLQKLYEKMHPLIKEMDEEFFTELVKEQILACIAPEGEVDHLFKSKGLVCLMDN